MNSTERAGAREDDSSTIDDLTLLRLWAIAWRDKWIIVALTALSGIAAVAYALLATEWYRADVLLVPAQQDGMSGFGEQLSSLAALAGMTAAPSESNTSEAIAVLQSREFAREFIEDKGLAPAFTGESPVSGKAGAEPVDMREAVRFFHENVLRVSQDRDTGHVALSVEWTDPAVASDWANSLVARLNGRMRQRALKEAEANVAYLQSELESNTLVPVQQSIGRLLETELQKLMLARGSEDFSFRIVDPATPPDRRARPKRTLIVVSAVFLGGVLALLVVFARNAFSKRPARHGGAAA
jgi:uncharacterized protein involved in exopolysaccharide biosynthesis